MCTPPIIRYKETAYCRNNIVNKDHSSVADNEIIMIKGLHCRAFLETSKHPFLLTSKIISRRKKLIKTNSLYTIGDSEYGFMYYKKIDKGALPLILIILSSFALMAFSFYVFMSFSDQSKIKTSGYDIFISGFLSVALYFLSKINFFPSVLIEKYERDTGLCYFLGHEKPCFFSDLISILRSSDNNFSFLLRHVTSGDDVIIINNADDLSDCYIWWELLQSFMDVTNPLPDIPELEPLRPYDPTTIEWDRKNKRPKNFYQRISKKGYRKIKSKVFSEHCQRASYEKRYPFGKNLAEAIKDKWYKPLPDKIWTLLPSEELGFESSLWEVYNPASTKISAPESEKTSVK